MLHLTEVCILNGGGAAVCGRALYMVYGEAPTVLPASTATYLHVLACEASLFLVDNEAKMHMYGAC